MIDTYQGFKNEIGPKNSHQVLPEGYKKRLREHIETKYIEQAPVKVSFWSFLLGNFLIKVDEKIQQYSFRAVAAAAFIGAFMGPAIIHLSTKVDKVRILTNIAPITRGADYSINIQKSLNDFLGKNYDITLFEKKVTNFLQRNGSKEEIILDDNIVINLKKKEEFISKYGETCKNIEIKKKKQKKKTLNIVACPEEISNWRIYYLK